MITSQLAKSIDRHDSVSPLSVIFLIHEGRYVKVAMGDIVLIEAQGNSTKVYTAQQEYLVKVNLGYFMEQLPEVHSNLLKVSRKHVVNIQAIDTIDGGSISIKELSVPISRRFHNEVMSRLPLIRSRSYEGLSVSKRLQK